MILFIGETLEGIFSAIGEAILSLLEGIGNILEPIFNYFSGEDIGYMIGQNFSSNTVAKPESYPQSTLAKDHPVKKMRDRESIISWLTANQPVNLPLAMSDRFYFNDEWRIKYEPLPLESYNLAQLKKIAAHFAINTVAKSNVKQSWIDAIAQKEKSYLDDFLSWSDALARSLK